MDRCEVGDQGAAAIEVARDLVAHRLARQHGELAAEVLLAQRPFLLEIVVLPLRLGEDEAATDLEPALDLLGADALGDGIEGGLHLAIDRDRIGRAILPQQLAEAALQRAADIAGVARASALAEV